jgi:coenzyme F420-reducing hydrogenase delta subunit/ferredoxin
MYEPKIVGFLCTWCSYTGADTAGIARMKYPANLRAIRVPCSGRVSPELIMRAFDQGADGVLVLGCHIGECHYGSGNHRTAKRIPILRSLMAYAGLEPERLKLDWVSASEGGRFSRIVSEFTAEVKALGPIQWRLEHPELRFDKYVLDPDSHQYEPRDNGPETGISSQDGRISGLDERIPDASLQIAARYTQGIQDSASRLLKNGEVECVIGYETGPRGHTRPVFVYDIENVHRLVWNGGCTHNLATYLPEKLGKAHLGDSKSARRIAVVAKACDTRAINVQLAENRYSRDQLHILGVVCPGIIDQKAPPEQGSARLDNPRPVQQARCRECTAREPYIYDSQIGDADSLREIVDFSDDSFRHGTRLHGVGVTIDAASSTERLEFWLGQFDRCLRCYACRQACPACNCPTCLYERDDSLWVRMGIGPNENRAFHLGRAFHLAGRCAGCDECERACPVGLPISLLNQCLAEEIYRGFGFRAGMTTAPPPLITMLSEEEV